MTHTTKIINWIIRKALFPKPKKMSKMQIEVQIMKDMDNFTYRTK